MVAVAYQGVTGSFSQQACQLLAKQVICETVVERPCRSFDEVFSFLAAGDELTCASEPRMAVVPMENSTIGVIGRVLDLLAESDVFVFSEITLPIHHQLIALPTASLEEIRQVQSHPAALEQCRDFFQNNPQLKAVAAYDTAGSVRDMVQSGDPTVAAIAAAEAVIEGAGILASNIEDFAGNQTRFALVGSPSFEWRCRQHGNAASRSLETFVAAPEDSLDTLVATTQSRGPCVRLLVRPYPQTPFAYRYFLENELSDQSIPPPAVRTLGRFCVHKPC